MLKKLSYIFNVSTFDHTLVIIRICVIFNSLSFYCVNFLSHFVLKLSVGTFPAFYFKSFSWKGLLIELVILVIKRFNMFCLCLMLFYLRLFWGFFWGG